VYVKHYGKVGPKGFCFESKVPARVGEVLNVRIVLLGLGVVVEISGKVLRNIQMKDHTVVICSFIAASEEIEKTIGKWIGMWSAAGRMGGTA
jgi:hypothetical protein